MMTSCRLSVFEMFSAKHGVAIRQRAAWLGFLWASLVVGCEHHATQPTDTTRPIRLAFIVQPINTTAGATLSPSIQVAAEDIDGNTVTTFAGTVTIALGTNPAGGSLSGTRVMHASHGIATFP